MKKKLRWSILALLVCGGILAFSELKQKSANAIMQENLEALTAFEYAGRLAECDPFGLYCVTLNAKDYPGSIHFL